MRKEFEALQPYLEKSMAIETALHLFEWDTETLAPKAAVEQTAKVVGILAGEAYDALINDTVKELVDQLSADREGLDEAQIRTVKLLAKDYEKLSCIPPEEYRAYSELQASAAAKWAEAKRENRYSSFMPFLKQMIEYTKKFARYRVKEGGNLYDLLLEDFEEGFPSETLDAFFLEMKTAIVPLLRKIREREQVESAFLFQNYEVEKQKRFCEMVADYVGFDKERGVIAESEHPFTANLHNKDVRITNHYYENNLESAVFSIIHEAGHGIYEMNVPDELTQTLLGGGVGMGMHESQSRFYENMIGRNKAFWEPLYPKLTEMFPEQLSEVSLDRFMAAINRTVPGLIRTEADELTYSLHVLIRYEIEKKIFNEDYPVEDLPKLWNDLYEEYLGIRPSNDAEGILQDIHWSQGSFGYFPSYALGSAISAQLLHRMKEELDFEALLRTGDLLTIRSWLTDKIHRFGKLKTTDELLLLTTGEPFCAKYYVEYLVKKFSEVYGL